MSSCLLFVTVKAFLTYVCVGKEGFKKRKEVEITAIMFKNITKNAFNTNSSIGYSRPRFNAHSEQAAGGR